MLKRPTIFLLSLLCASAAFAAAKTAEPTHHTKTPQTAKSDAGSENALTINTENDPYETFNRHAFRLNRKLDDVFLKPVATIYKNTAPKPVKKGVHNFFSNLSDIPTFFNDLLQAKFKQGTMDFWRFTINSTIGIGGLFDVASHMNLPKHHEDFGLTLAEWGVKDSPYVVIPFLGPSTVRDAVGKPFDYFWFTPYTYFSSDALSYGLITVNVIDARATLLDAQPLIDQVSLDPYIFERDAYLQNRAYQIAQDSNASQSDDLFEMGDPLANPPQ